MTQRSKCGVRKCQLFHISRTKYEVFPLSCSFLSYAARSPLLSKCVLMWLLLLERPVRRGRGGRKAGRRRKCITSFILCITHMILRGRSKLERTRKEFFAS